MTHMTNNTCRFSELTIKESAESPLVVFIALWNKLINPAWVKAGEQGETVWTLNKDSFKQIQIGPAPIEVQ